MGAGWSIGRKLGACCAAIAALLAVFGVHAERTFARLGESHDLAVNRLAKKAGLAGALDTAAERMRSSARGLVLGAYSKNTREAGQAQAEFHAAEAEFTRSIDGARALAGGDRERRMAGELRKDLDSMAAAFARIERLCGGGGGQVIRAAG